MDQSLQQWLRIHPDRVVVAGDSGNDLEMYFEPYRGIIVAEADPQLKERQGQHIYHAQGACAAGVLEGIRHWQVLA
jgi:hydroxymethylpyrimidine pyrophosphatase-like HAD family hydrolase